MPLGDLINIEQMKQGNLDRSRGGALANFDELMKTLAQYLQRKRAEEGFQGMFPQQANIAPPTQPPAVVPQQSGGPAVMPRAGTASVAPSQTPDPALLLQEMAAGNPMAKNYVEGARATAPTTQMVSPGVGGMQEVQRNPLTGATTMNERVPPQSRPIDPLQQDLIRSQIERNRRGPAASGQQVDTIPTGKTKTEGGVRLKEVQDINKLTRQPLPGSAPRWEPWTQESATTQALNAADFRPDLGGESLLKALPVGDRALVDSIRKGNVDPNKATSMRGANRERIMKLVTRVDPTYDQKWIDATKALMKDATVGNLARSARSLNMVVGHIEDMKAAADELKNNAWQTGNTITNYIKENLGNPIVTRFNLARDAVKSEMAASFKAGVGTASPTDQEIMEWGKTLNYGLSDAQFNAWVDTADKLLGSRLMALESQKNVPGIAWPPGFDILSSRAREILSARGFDFSKYTGGTQGGGQKKVVNESDLDKMSNEELERFIREQ